MIHNKAVRDKIPEVVKSSGKTCNIKALPDDEFLVEIEKKLSEEIAEYLHVKNPEELADILEVVYAIARLRGISEKQLDEIRCDKVEERGAFLKNLFLIDTSY